MRINYTVSVEINASKEELDFDFDIKEIEEDGIYLIMDNAIENHIQEHYCTCSFNESQNYCDCDNDYNGYEITKREVLKDN